MALAPPDSRRKGPAAGPSQRHQRSITGPTPAILFCALGDTAAMRGPAPTHDRRGGSAGRLRLTPHRSIARGIKLHTCIVPPRISMPAPSLLLMQLADSAFPAGGLNHSQGLEAAMQSGRVGSAAALKPFAVEVLQLQVIVLPRLASRRDPSAHRRLCQVSSSLPFVTAGHQEPTVENAVRSAHPRVFCLRLQTLTSFWCAVRRRGLTRPARPPCAPTMSPRLAADAPVFDVRNLPPKLSWPSRWTDELAVYSASKHCSRQGVPDCSRCGFFECGRADQGDQGHSRTVRASGALIVGGWGSFCERGES